jgi:DNA-binding PadR family transcriptional regulator
MKKTGYLDMRGMLSFYVLWLVSRGSICGEDLTKEIGRRRGEEPNPGTLYPALKGLREAGLIEPRREDKKIFYTITLKGREELETATNYFKQVYGDILSGKPVRIEIKAPRMELPKMAPLKPAMWRVQKPKEPGDDLGIDYI